VRELDGARGNLLPNVPALFANTLVQSLRAADNFVWASFDLADLTQAAATPSLSWRRCRRAAAAATPTGSLASSAPGSGTGLLAQYFSMIDESELAQTQVDPVIDNIWSGTGPLEHDPRGPERQLLGDLVGLHRGAGHRHLHDLRHHRRRHADPHRRRAGGRRLLLPGADRALRARSTWSRGQRYPIRIRYFEGGGLTEAHVSWQTPAA
jgi:hypothetical protein